MQFNLREYMGFTPRVRLGVVAGLVLALLAFPCGPLAALGWDARHALAAAHVVPADSGQGDAECTHRTKKHESSCCNECSSWLTARSDGGAGAILNFASSHRDLPPLAITYITPNCTRPDKEPRVTGPPSVAPLDGTSIYLQTQRYRI